MNTQEISTYSSSFINCISHIINTAYQFVYTSVVSLIDLAPQFVGSNLFMTIFGTLAAAFAGSFGAQHFINKQQKKDALLSEIRNINSAIMTAFNICNSCLSLKKQHVKSLKEEFDLKRNELEQFKKDMKNEANGPENIFAFRADFQSLPPLTLPIELLEKQIFEKVSAKGRALGLTITLITTIQSLNRSINHRNTTIQWIKENVPTEEHERLVQLYFGLPDRNGHIDNNYPDTINAINNLTDDCIFFSKLLCADLKEHGTKLKENLRDKSIVISEPDFEIAEKAELMPDEENYDDWYKMFKSK